MGQILRKDKIGALSESGGTITLASSILTIGGQQYQTGSLSVAANLSSINTRYEIYAISTAGVISIVTSQNENSVGPAGSDAWKLVGSYRVGDIGSFGVFINIVGVPITEFYNVDTPSSTWGGGFTTHTEKMKINGDEIIVKGYFLASGSQSGAFYSDIPHSWNIDTDKLPITAGNYELGGTCSVTDASNSSRPRMSGPAGDVGGQNAIRAGYINTTQVRYTYGNIQIGSSTPIVVAVGDWLSYSYRVPIVELSNTPIEDL